MTTQRAEMPDVWSVYLASDDARKTVEATVEHGGQVLVDAMDVADLGTGAADTDAALARVVDLGGSIVTPAQDTPYGRLATAADPTGL